MSSSYIDLIVELAWSDELTLIADYKLSTSPIFLYAMLYEPGSNKLSKSIPGVYFSPYLVPGSEHPENRFPEVTFDNF